MTEWQPIETAPQDGKRFLVFIPEYGIHEAFASTAGDVLHGRIEIEGHVFPFDLWNQHTYKWMPLPETPKEEHYCTARGDWICKANKNTGKGLILSDYRGMWVGVVCCPFCGKEE